MNMSDKKNMVVETTGDFMLQDVTMGQDIQPHRPTVVKNSAFVQQRIASDHIRVLDPETDMTDDELNKKWLAGKYKASKKQPIKHPEREALVEQKPSDVAAPTPSEPAKFRDQKEGESDDDYLKALQEFHDEQKKPTKKV
jgi:hypothetical protein